jgi:predicted MFS family arabinose efflux permease
MPPSDDLLSHEPVIHDAIGPDLPAREAAAAIALGVIALLMAGVQPALLGQLADDGRLSASEIGLTATCEALSLGLTTALAGILISPRGLRAMGVVAALLVAVASVAMLGAHGTGVIVLRTLTGVPEGILFWIAVGMIARTQTPERWAGVYMTALTASQLALMLILELWVLPAHGTDGGFLAMGATGLLGAAAALSVPNRYAPLIKSDEESGLPPPRGWFALLATLVYIGATATVGVYLQPLAHEAGLSADVARLAVSVSLAVQIFGGATATLAAGHLRYIAAFALTTVVIIVSWLAFATHVPAWLFIAANAVNGFIIVFVTPFVVPMTIQADPSRKAAVLSGSTQVLAGALGPFAASQVVADNAVRGAVTLGIVSLVAGLALIGVLHFTSARNDHTV